MGEAVVPADLVALSCTTWPGPRHCQVASAMADSSVSSLWPTRSLAQGDSCAPKVLCQALAPWETYGARFLFMDNRSMVCSSKEELRSDVACASAFDEGTWELSKTLKDAKGGCAARRRQSSMLACLLSQIPLRCPSRPRRVGNKFTRTSKLFEARRAVQSLVSEQRLLTSSRDVYGLVPSSHCRRLTWPAS